MSFCYSIKSCGKNLHGNCGKQLNSNTDYWNARDEYNKERCRGFDERIEELKELHTEMMIYNLVFFY